jgi:broad specificity phosphatase PhoE
MPQLILVRHAQASFFGARYDELSDLGRRQAAALGAHWIRHGVEFERVFVGPKRRHRDTCDIVAGAYAAAGRPFPRPIEMPELDEHQGARVMNHAVGLEPGAETLHPAEVPETERAQAIRDFFRDYERIMRDWARGLLSVEGVESWEAFRARSLKALDLLCEGPAAGLRVAFTSGGLVSSAAGWLLGLDAERVIDLSAVLRNTALTEVHWSARRRRLISFNGLPHLQDPRAATAV